MLETYIAKLGHKQLFQLRNTREIHELLRILENKLNGFIFPEKSYNDQLFTEMLKRDTYIVPIFQDTIPVYIYMCYYHNNPCVFIISLQSLETIYILPAIINIEFETTILYGELIKYPTTILNIERVIFTQNRLVNYSRYNKQIELINKLHNMLNIDWIIPKPIYHITEMEDLVKSCNNIQGIRFYSFKNPVIFYKNTKDLSKKMHLIKHDNCKLFKPKEYWITKNNNMKQIEPIYNKLEINNDIIYNLFINTITYGIYKVSDNENKDYGVIRLKTFEEHDELSLYLKKYKNIQIKLQFDNKFNKWIIPTKSVKDAIIKAY